MCTRYISPDDAAMERHWHVGRTGAWRGLQHFPRSSGPFIRRGRHTVEPNRELVIGQWGLIPWFAKTSRLTYSTVNARYEGIAEKASFKEPWHRSQRCVIPADSFDEPCWETGKNVWWRFRRIDGRPWGLAGLWNTWTDPASGEQVESYTMLTVNADGHPIMSRMHKPDPRLPGDRQDKRSVVSLEPEDVDAWLFAPANTAQQLLKPVPADVCDAGPIGAP